MAINQASDRYNPQGTTDQDWETHKYYDMPDGEIFFMERSRNVNNNAYRKTNDKEALNTKMQTVHEVLSDIVVYTKL